MNFSPTLAARALVTARDKTRDTNNYEYRVSQKATQSHIYFPSSRREKKKHRQIMGRLADRAQHSHQYELFFQSASNCSLLLSHLVGLHLLKEINQTLARFLSP